MADDIDLESGPVTVRDALEAAVEQHREPVTQESGAATERARDEAGRFARAQEKAAEAAAEVVEPVVEQVARPARPSSWKKDYEEQWNTLDPKLAEYIHQREREYSTGVSTYKAEAERARSIQSAIEPFMPDLQRHNIAPEQWIKNLGSAHQTLALGSPQQKIQMFAQLAQDYGVDLRAFVGQDGAPQVPQVDQQTRWMQEQIAQMRGQLTQFTEQRQQQEQAQIQAEIERIRADTDKYPHFDTVRETMAGILQSGLAQDLSSAYDKAIRMHDDLWNSQQEAQRANAEAERQRAAAEAAKSARAKVVSVKSSTPSGQATTATKAKGRREALEEAFASQGSGRV